jgi:transposase
VQRGELSRRAAARRYEISESIAIKWLERVERDGSREPVGHGGHRPSKLMPHRDFLEAARAETPDVTLQALCDRLLAERGVKADTSLMWLLSPDRRHVQKKTVVAREQDRPDISRHRQRWQVYQGLIDPGCLVFIDETWTKTNMTRLRGWAPKGERLVDKVPHGRWKTATFLAALRNDRIDAPCLFDGPINGERFHAYVEQFLVPTLKPGDVVILDNLGSHKAKAVRRAIREVGRASCSCPNIRPTSIQ